MMIIAIDFDGTIVEHAFPRIGRPIPLAIEWMKAFQRAGAKLILWTMRSDSANGRYLQDAIDYCKSHGVEFFGHNANHEQSTWTTSPKAYAHIYIDDAAFGCPLIKTSEDRPFVDWSIVGPAVMEEIKR